ncbi:MULTISPECIES: hypothetical protein [Lactococcus]|uniref:Uncharacterized protein n=2 Tax=Lactococcus TaxID=1357 RepID=V8ARN9_9LACT|nr:MULTISPECIES: hypothetical protein [Lactococcus]ETD05619.1 hypothetical protein N568_0101695 [Lactococcus garvieae TRF1]USI67572.1 hypothetical protein LMK04_08760 [Lactococcus petauri]WJE12233.1 hypothetical protein QR692_08665 [Lactococcus petauri]
MNMKKILLLFLSFWVPALVVLVISYGAENSASYDNTTTLSFYTIVARNIIVIALLVITGYIHKNLSYFIFYFNAIYFSIILILSGNVGANLIKVSKYGIIEVLSLSIACYAGIEKKYSLLWISTLLIIFAGIIETLIIKGVL